MEKTTVRINGIERQAWGVGRYLVMHAMSKNCPTVQLGPNAGMYFPHGTKLTEVRDRRTLKLVTRFESIGQGIVWAAVRRKV